MNKVHDLSFEAEPSGSSDGGLKLTPQEQVLKEFFNKNGRVPISAIISGSGVSINISTQNQWRNNKNGGYLHKAIDMPAPIGTEVRSPGSGVVDLVKLGSESAGNYIRIYFPASGVFLQFMHMDKIDPSLKKGSVVSGGTKIGRSGNTGHSTGPHLHLEVHKPMGTKIVPQVVFDYDLPLS